MRKQKAIFFVRGDRQIKNLDYFDSYYPVAPWLTIRMLMNVADQRGWEMQHVNFSDALVQYTLEEEVYFEMPAIFRTNI